MKEVDIRYFQENKELFLTNCPKLSVVDCSSLRNQTQLVKLDIQETPSLEKIVASGSKEIEVN